MSRIIGNDIARFWSKVLKDGPIPANRPDLGPCWTWLGSRTGGGYAQFRARKTTRCSSAHVFSYFIHKGPVPNGAEIDHLCRNRACCNPEHLEAVTHRENIRRGETFPAWHAQQTHCLRGHEFTQENTFINNRGERQCRDCNRLRQSKSWVKVRTGNYIGASGNRKLSLGQVREIHRRYRAGESRLALCDEFSISYSSIEKLLRGIRWPEVLEEFNRADLAKIQAGQFRLTAA